MKELTKVGGYVRKGKVRRKKVKQRIVLCWQPVTDYLLSDVGGVAQRKWLWKFRLSTNFESDCSPQHVPHDSDLT